MNPFDALAEFVLGRMKQSAMALWLKLIFELVFSAIVAFLFVAGTVALSTRSWLVGLATGMVMAAICMVAVFRRSPLTKGLTVVLPGAEAAREIGSDLQTIERK